MQKKIRIAILVVVIIFGFCLIRDFCIKSLIGTIAGNITGAPTSVGGLSLSVIGQSVKISHLKMYNPKGFPKDILADIAKIQVRYDLFAIITGKIHLQKLDLQIKELGMAKNKEGLLNVDSLKISEGKMKEETKKKPSKPLNMQIDEMNLAMGRVVSKDYSVSGPYTIKVYDINTNKAYKDITSAQQLAALIISEPLKAAGIQGLKLYGASMLTGVAALPVALAFTLAAKDYAEQVFSFSWERVYSAGLEAMKKAGKVNSEDKNSGVITGEVDGASVTLELKKLSARSTQVNISARKFGFPQIEIASGVMYRLNEEF